MDELKNNSMNDTRRNELRQERFATINDMEDDEINVYKTNYDKQNTEVIRMYLSYVDRAVLDQTFVGRCVNPINDIAKNSSITWIYSDLKYGYKDVFVPIDFYTLTETVLSLNCNLKGIFRVRNSIDTVKTCVKTLEDEIRKRSRYEYIRNVLAENFNVIDLTTAFKEVVRNYKYTVIPQNFLPIILKTNKIGIKSHRLIIYHYIYISMPKFNRHLLEATIYFLYLIHDIATDCGKDYSNNMDMEGISTVMMPNLLLKSNDDADLETVPILVEFMKELVINFRHIAKEHTVGI